MRPSPVTVLQTSSSQKAPGRNGIEVMLEIMEQKSSELLDCFRILLNYQKFHF